MGGERHVLARVCLFTGAVVIVMSLLLLNITGTSLENLDAMRLGWAGLSAGTALVLCAAETFFSARRIKQSSLKVQTNSQIVLVEVSRAAGVGALLALLIVLMADSLLERSPAAVALKSMTIPLVIVGWFAYGAPRLLDRFRRKSPPHVGSGSA
jgi:hypothetical protein